MHSDVTKRYGNLSNGCDDIKKHRLFNDLCWIDIKEKSSEAPYTPLLQNEDDLSYFEALPDSNNEIQEISNENDPFYSWK